MPWEEEKENMEANRGLDLEGVTDPTAAPGDGTAANEAAPESDEKDGLQQEMKQLQEENRKLQEQYLRALADADNLRKRSVRDKEEYLKFAPLPLIRKLLPAIDDLERALKASAAGQDYESLSKGVEMISRSLQDIIREQGVEAIESLGKEFDPQFHQALMVEASDKHPENTVTEELQKGYIMHGRVIRPSLVKVAGSTNGN